MKSAGERGVCVPMPHCTAGLREAVVATGAGRARGTTAAAVRTWPHRLGRPAYAQQALEMPGRAALRRCLPSVLPASAARQPHVRLYRYHLPLKIH